MSAIVFEDEQTLRVLRNTAGVLERVIGPIAEALSLAASEEGGAVQSKLGGRWGIVAEGDSIRHVVAPEWWAGFFAGGTKDHGPVSAPALVFTVGGNTIHTSMVRGIPASHFDKKAVDQVIAKIPGIVERMMEEAAHE